MVIVMVKGDDGLPGEEEGEEDGKRKRVTEGNSNMKNRSNRRRGGKERVREGTIGEGREEDRKTKKERVI